MGAGGSKASLDIGTENPFPLSPAMQRDLDKASLVAARILAKPDLYDIDNLARPGVCGEYAIFLKEQLVKQLKEDAAGGAFRTFVTDISGKRTELLYGNPRKLIGDKTRDEICKRLANSMLRAIAIIVASLASIQVATPSRKVVVSGIVQQTGGALQDVRDWLVQKQYIMPADVGKPVGSPMELRIQIPHLAAKKLHFYLTLGASVGNMTNATISVRGKPADEPEMPTGALRAQFLNPIAIPSSAGQQSVLPLRIIDAAGMPWFAGVLYENIFKSLHNDPAKPLQDQQLDLTTMLEALFRKTQGWSVTLPTRTDTQTANTTFGVLQRTGSADALYAALGTFFQQRVPGYQPGFAGVVPQPYPPAPHYGYAPQPLPPPPPPAYAYGPPATSLVHAPAPGQALQYTIPQSASKTLLETLKSFRQQLALENSPAAMRAQTLAGVTLPNRDVQTNVCNDPYWTLPNLSRVYPWATLQFLCVEDWNTLTGDRSKVRFNSVWKSVFLSGLRSAYGNKIVLDKPEAEFLDQIKVTTNSLRVCAAGPAARVKPKQVKDALLEIQGLYERHVANVWEILNSLIVVLKDAETQTEFVRLHPNVTAGDSSEAYIQDIAAKATNLLAKFYVDVERTYVNAAERLLLA